MTADESTEDFMASESDHRVVEWIFVPIIFVVGSPAIIEVVVACCSPLRLDFLESFRWPFSEISA